jgi:hypothetical protein
MEEANTGLKINKNTIKKEILLLNSAANTGKTTTIIKLHNTFIAQYGLNGTQQSPNKDFREFYNDPKLNGNIVGFASPSDDLGAVQDNCNFFLGNHPENSGNICNICITACRPRKTKRVILVFARKHNYNVSFFEYQVYPNNISGANVIANDEKARMMLDRIKYLV